MIGGMIRVRDRFWYKVRDRVRHRVRDRTTVTKPSATGKNAVSNPSSPPYSEVAIFRTLKPSTVYISCM